MERKGIKSDYIFIRATPELKTEVRKVAKKENVTITSLLTYLIEKGLKAFKRRGKK